MQSRNPLTDPETGDIVEAVVEGKTVVRLVTMMFDDNTITPIVFDSLIDNTVYPSDKSSVASWRTWCEKYNALVKQKGNT